MNLVVGFCFSILIGRIECHGMLLVVKELKYFSLVACKQ